MTQGFAIKLSFEVGTTERHHVDFGFDQFWGGLRISVDGYSVVRTIRIFSTSLVKSYEFVVGTTEQHTVRIEKTRKLLFAGFRAQVVSAFVDGELVASDQSLGGPSTAVISPSS